MDHEKLSPGITSASSAADTNNNAFSEGRSLRVYTLGRFSLVRNGQPLRWTHKAPSRALLLLKALIATGGRQVAVINLASILWPDLDGDKARRSFEITLHRLRKFLGDDSYLLIQGGLLTLNSANVWVDLWEFERGVSSLRKLLDRPGDTAENPVSTLSERCMQLYQGHFLGREESTCWSVSLQERLRNRFVHTLLETGRYWEQHGMHSRAIACYRKGIETDDLIESFYQRLMLCLSQTGQLSEAIAVYRQCRHILSVVLGLEPGGETRTLYNDILSRYRQAG